MIRVTAWMNLEDITLNKTSQSQKDKYCVIYYMRYLDYSDSKRKLPGARKGGNGEVVV